MILCHYVSVFQIAIYAKANSSEALQGLQHKG
jgi:hypothetical protein